MPIKTADTREKRCQTERLMAMLHFKPDCQNKVRRLRELWSYQRHRRLESPHRPNAIQDECVGTLWMAEWWWMCEDTSSWVQLESLFLAGFWGKAWKMRLFVLIRIHIRDDCFVIFCVTGFLIQKFSVISCFGNKGSILCKNTCI